MPAAAKDDAAPCAVAARGRPRAGLHRILAALLSALAVAASVTAGVTAAVAAGVTAGVAEDAVPPPAARPDQTEALPRFYFFSPDWRPPDLGRLTAAFEQATAAGGVPVSFQAFTRYEDFARQVAEQPPDFLIAPAWMEGESGRSVGIALVPIAHPLRHGKATYRKALMTKPGIDSIDDLARGSIAATLYAMGDGSPGAVLGAFHLAADSAKVVPVPKDVDALLALSFGQVDAALVTSEQYDLLAKSNPSEAGRLRVLAFTPEIRLPPVFACGERDPGLTERLAHVLLGFGETREGPAVLALLGFDRFVAETKGAVADAPPPAAPATGRDVPPRPSPRPSSHRTTPRHPR